MSPLTDAADRLEARAADLVGYFGAASKSAPECRATAALLRAVDEAHRPCYCQGAANVHCEEQYDESHCYGERWPCTEPVYVLADALAQTVMGEK